MKKISQLPCATVRLLIATVAGLILLKIQNRIIGYRMVIEGLSDIYRDVLCRGGIPSPEFDIGIMQTLRYTKGIEDLPAMLEKYPAINDYWAKEKRPDFSKITLPAYFVASWNSNVHVYGTFRAYKLSASKEKWLRVHNTME